MIIPHRHTMAFAPIAGAARFIALAPTMHAHEEKMPAYSAGVIRRAHAIDTWGAINGLREELAARIAAKNVQPVHEITERLGVALAKLREPSRACPRTS